MPDNTRILELVKEMQGDPDAVPFLVGWFLYGTKPEQVERTRQAWKDHKKAMSNPGNGA